MTDAREYPREWFRVPTFGGCNIETRMMERETAKMLFWRTRSGIERRELKETISESWFPTLAEAEAAQAAHRARIKAAQERAQRNAFSLDLLQAAESVLASVDTDRAAFVAALDDMRTAVARARGERLAA